MSMDRFPHVYGRERDRVPFIPQESEFYGARYTRHQLIAAECTPGTPRSTRVLVRRRWWKAPEWVTVSVDKLEAGSGA